VDQGIKVYYPRFIAFPGIFRNLDAFFMAISGYFLIKKLKRNESDYIIDSHFTYPDGLAATYLAKWLDLKSVITMRGTEVPHSLSPNRLPLLINAWNRSDKIISVSNSLRKLAIAHDISPEKVQVVGNGVDTSKFTPAPIKAARDKLNIGHNNKVLITVAGLVERKGFHRVIECMPALLKNHSNLMYLIVGGVSAEGNYEAELRRLVNRLNLKNHVNFIGAIAPEKLNAYLSAADVFVLASSNEGWANVILESMSCGTPVVATDVGGNAEVIKSNSCGRIVPFGDTTALTEALDESLKQEWDQNEIVGYARKNHWDNRIASILKIYDDLLFTKQAKI
jgi:glycosyltransferase involved in cell wall biosynthesis